MKQLLKSSISRYWNRLNNGPRIITPQSYQSDVPNKLGKPFLNILLFFMTILTTSFVGGGPGFDSIVDRIIEGLPYGISIVVILLSHEMGHYFASRRFGISTTLPYFIPFPPPSEIGTLGAVIKTKSPIPHTRALLYVGVMGPLPGFFLSLAALIIGVYLTEPRPFPPHSADDSIMVLGNSCLTALIVIIKYGHMPVGLEVFHSPLARAGWFGFLITSLNLIPLGQLDGGHILYALIGKKQRILGWLSLTALIIFAYAWIGWILWIVITLTFLMVAHPEIPQGPSLSFTEKLMGWSCMVILVLTFMPVPAVFR